MTVDFRSLSALAGTLLLGALVVGAPAALAQDDAAQDAAAEAVAGFPYDAYLTDTVDLTRWADSEVVVKQLGKGEKIEVVAVSGDKTRVRKGTSFGWVSSSLVTTEVPEGTAGIGGLSLPPSLGGGE